ncbi:acetate kinase [Blautia wexlerae]|nr:acetate kinase [Blautia wexlerae]
MNVLVINCGSSSLKYQLINSDSEAVLAKGLCERIGIDGRLVYQKTGCDKEITEVAMPTHKEAIQMVLDALTNDKTGAIGSLKEVNAVGHRVVHGGEKFAKSVVITDEVISAVEECNDLAPLHNPANLIGIRVCSELMPGVPQVAVFDTAFHQTMPAKAYLYGLPIEYYKNYKVRRYGFHGTSHSFVSKRAVEFLGLDKDNSKVIVCHLGNGSSISAVVNGQCVDTTMGLTPLEGVVMGTRSGNIDPAIMEFIAKKENLDIAGMMNVLNKKSGLLGLSGGLSSDFRDLNDASSERKRRCSLTQSMFSAMVSLNSLADMLRAMNGVDAIVFTAGIGENAIPVREKVVSYLGYLGVTLDKEANGVRGEEIVISTPDSKVKVAVIPTNEELAICRETVALV